MNRSVCRAGFTLIESLAVLALLGLVFGAVGTGLLASADRRSEIDSTTSLLVQADARTRLEARRTGAQLLRLATNRQTLIRSSTSQLTGDDTQLAAWSHRVRVTLLDEHGSPTEELLIDRTGRSADYSIQIAGGGQTQTLKVSGLTGWITKVSDP